MTGLWFICWICILKIIFTSPKGCFVFNIAIYFGIGLIVCLILYSPSPPSFIFPLEITVLLTFLLVAGFHKWTRTFYCFLMSLFPFRKLKSLSTNSPGNGFRSSDSDMVSDLWQYWEESLVLLYIPDLVVKRRTLWAMRYQQVLPEVFS